MAPAIITTYPRPISPARKQGLRERRLIPWKVSHPGGVRWSPETEKKFTLQWGWGWGAAGGKSIFVYC